MSAERGNERGNQRDHERGDRRENRAGRGNGGSTEHGHGDGHGDSRGGGRQNAMDTRRDDADGEATPAGRRRHPAGKTNRPQLGGQTVNSGDKPVDGVDNSGQPSPDTLTDVGVDHRKGDIPSVTGLAGADLARAALEAAKQAAKARGRMPTQRRSNMGRNAVGRGRRRSGWSGARPDDRDPQPLGRLAARIAVDRGWTENLSGGAVFGRWAELVGAEVAEHASPVSLRDGELTVQAVSTAWATQLRLLQRELLSRIAAGAGRGVVTRLRIHGPSAPSWRHGNRRVPGRGPRDTYG